MKGQWNHRKIGDLFKTSAGGTPLKSNREFYENGSIPWLLSGEVGRRDIVSSKTYITEKGLASSSAKIFPKNTVLVAMYGATAGEVGILRFESATNQAVCGIFPNDDFLPEFLYYSLMSKRDELVSQASGNAQPNISQIKVRNTLIPVLPVSQQRRIVAKLDEAFVGIATATVHAEKNLRNARELFESTLHSVFANRGEGWGLGKLEDIVEKECSLSYGIVQPGVNISNGLPVVRPTDLTERVIRLEGLKRIDPSLADAYRRTTLRGGDLLLCVRGSTGTISVASMELVGSNVTRGIVPIRFDSSVMSQEFGYYQIRSKSVQDQIKDGTYGAALTQINIRDLRKLVLAVPPREFQNAVVRKLDGLSEEVAGLERIYRKELELYNELKQSLLQKAFAGELH